MSQRGTTLRLRREDVVRRAHAMVAARPKNRFGEAKPIAYRLDGGFNGGFDPTAEHCASWSYGNRTPTSDCIGLALYASGIDRMQPGYKGSRGEWLNCASLLDDADGARKFCRPLSEGEHPLPGDWLLTRSHIGVIVRVDGGRITVVDCSPRHGRQTAVNTGGPWSKNCRVIRPLFYAP